MKNKVLINIYVPSVDEKYELYIPVNESIGKVLELIIQFVFEVSDSNFNLDKNHYLLDPDTASMYTSNQIVRDTNIRNNKKIILV